MRVFTSIAVSLVGAIAGQRPANRPDERPTEVAALLQQLERGQFDDATCSRFARLGETAVRALVVELVAAKPRISSSVVLAVLMRCKPSGGAAVGKLLKLEQELSFEDWERVLSTIAELGPYSEHTAKEMRIEFKVLAQRVARTRGRNSRRLPKVLALYNRANARMAAKHSEATDALLNKIASHNSAQAAIAAELLAVRREVETIETIREHLLARIRRKKTTPCDAMATAIVSLDAQSPHADVAHCWRLMRPAFAADERVASLRALALLGEQCDQELLLEALAKALAGAEVRVLREAVTTASTLGPGAAELAGQLTALTEHADKQVRLRAKAALRAIRGR